MTIAQTASRGTAPRRFLWVLLALSLALNLFFVVGALWIRVHKPFAPITPEQRLHEMAAQLGLDSQQRQAFDDYARTMREQLRLMREAARPLIGQAWSEVAKPEADETRVMQLLDEAAQQRRRFLQGMTLTTHAFLATLSPEQRAEFVELARRRSPPWSAPPHRGSH